MPTIESNTAKINYQEYVQDTLQMAFRHADDQNVLIDVTGWTVDLEIRKQANDLNPVLVVNEQNGVVLGGTDYNILITVTDDQTLALGAGTFAYFVRTKDLSGFVNTLALGKLTLRTR